MNKTSYNGNTNMLKSACTDEINVKISDIILTPLTCASIISELIKLLVYQKSQIPYPYNLLKSVLNKERKNVDSNQSNPQQFKIEQHFKVVSSAFASLQDIIANLYSEFENFGYGIKQVVILFGATVYCPREVFRIHLGDIPKGHSENNHLPSNSRNQHKILRDIVLAEQWLSATTAIPPTNMFVLIQKISNTQDKDSFFELNEQYVDPIKSRNTTINLEYDNTITYNCCEQLQVFNDEKDLNGEVLKPESCCGQTTHCCNPLWYQARVVLQGFKGYFINNVSAMDLW